MIDLNRFWIIYTVISGLVFLAGCRERNTSGSSLFVEDNSDVLFQSDFSGQLDTLTWAVEIDSLAQSSVAVRDGKLVLDTKGGVTVWLKKKLEGNLEITHTREVQVEDGVNDRLSDLNQFWMATDPRNQDLFTRTGKFEEYDSLQMYYVGFGGNYNTTSRFRKYHGDGRKEIVQEHVGKDHLLEPNRIYEIRIRIENGNVRFWVDDELFFNYADPDPLTEGYFGFRSTWSRHKIDNLKIISLD